MHNLTTTSKISVGTEHIYQQTGREYTQEADKPSDLHHFENQLQKIFKKYKCDQNDLAFWNAMVEGRLESIAGIINLFILMLIESLGGKTYNGQQSKGVLVLGWTSIGQVCLVYILVVLLKFVYIPHLQCELKNNKSQGFMLLGEIHKGRKKLSDLELEQIEDLLSLFEQKQNQVRLLISRNEAESLVSKIKQLLNSHSHQEYHSNSQIQVVKKVQNKAKYWKHFWQVFMLGKTYSVPGTIFLLLIIILASITKVSGNNILAQGWIAIILWIASAIVYSVIKLCFWDFLNQEVQKLKSQPFVNFNSIYYKFKELGDLNLSELEQLQSFLRKRSEQFAVCFPNLKPKEVLESVKNLLGQRLPKKQNQNQDEKIRQLSRKQRDLMMYHATWLNFFNARMISTIINSLKFLIVIALSFDKYYPSTSDGVYKAHIAVGSIGILILVFGQLFYWYLRCYGLKNMEKEVLEASCQPFRIYRLVYFGNKQLQDLQVFELQEIEKAIVNRNKEFADCFPKTSIQSLSTKLKQILTQRSESLHQNKRLSTLLKNELAAKQSVAFWTGYIDGPLMTSIYSIYVLLVLLVVSIIAGNNSAAAALGWVGVGVLGCLIITSLYFKCYILQRLQSTAKSLRVEGLSEFHQVYTKAKELKSVNLIQLKYIQNIIRSSPNEFLRFFPHANLEKTLNEIAQLKNQPNHRQEEKVLFDIRVDLQVQRLQLSRYKNLLAFWQSWIKERLYVQLPIAVVIFILWVQTIATSLSGLKVCGFSTVILLSLAVSLILFYKLFYKEWLQGAIKKIESKIRLLEADLLHS